MPPDTEMLMYHEDRKLIDFRLTTMENAIIKLADTVHEYISSNDKITTELKVRVALGASVFGTLGGAAAAVIVRFLLSKSP